MLPKLKLTYLLLLTLLLLILSAKTTLAVTCGTSTNVDSTDKWAWNDVFGWINFFSDTSVNVSASLVNGCAVFESFTSDLIAFDCATTPNGNICGGAAGNWKVSNDGNGVLSGWGWSDLIGWVSFNCSNTDTCATSNYSVTVNAAGDFTGWAWNDTIGWISFNCSNTGTCGTVSYKVKTVWTAPASGNLVSSTFDTGYASGVAYNSITWQGTLPSGGIVRFQLATSNCSNGATDAPTCATNVGWGGGKTSGDGAFLGTDGTSSTYYQPTGPNSPVQIVSSYHNNRRYFRYKLFIDKGGGSTSPIVDDVIVNWSP